MLSSMYHSFLFAISTNKFDDAKKPSVRTSYSHLLERRGTRS